MNNMFGVDNNGMYIISDYDLQGDIVTRVSKGGLTDRTKLLLLVLLGSLVAAAIGAALGLFLMLRCDAPEDGDCYYDYGDRDKDNDKLTIAGEGGRRSPRWRRTVSQRRRSLSRSTRWGGGA